MSSEQSLESKILSRRVATLVTIDEKVKVITIEKKDSEDFYDVSKSRPYSRYDSLLQKLSEFRSNDWDRYKNKGYTVVITDTTMIDDRLDSNCLIWFVRSRFKVKFQGRISYDGADELLKELNKWKKEFPQLLNIDSVEFTPKYMDGVPSKFSDPDDQPSESFETIQKQLNKMFKPAKK
jgi:hypothetical protein